MPELLAWGALAATIAEQTQYCLPLVRGVELLAKRQTRSTMRTSKRMVLLRLSRTTTKSRPSVRETPIFRLSSKVYDHFKENGLELLKGNFIEARLQKSIDLRTLSLFYVFEKLD